MSASSLVGSICRHSDIYIFFCIPARVWFSVSVQCLKTPSEAINPQSQADMVTRVFWIAVSLLESDYEHEFLMAIHLLNKVSLLEKRGNVRTTKLSALLVQNSTEYVLEIDSSSQTILINETSFVNVPVWLDSPLLLPPSPSPPPRLCCNTFIID